ncbi:MAG TPA: LON peptidase substrate-binding domain-containing protein [Azospira sp.]|nr:LON peptidase substrate-binding domain-containing protein [Azospira sp.]
MNWFARRAEPTVEPAAAERIEIPLFPLKSVLFPGGTLALKVFEQRYLDMSADCLRREQPFGICLIAHGQEVGEPAQPHPVGTLAHVASWDMEALGILQLGVRGGRRFRIVDTRGEADGLLRATVELLPEGPPVAVPAAQRALLPILEKVAADIGPEKMPLPHDWNDAAWVGYRLSEVMPVQLLAKQKLLELDDAVSRLEILFKFLAQRGLVK